MEGDYFEYGKTSLASIFYSKVLIINKHKGTIIHVQS